MTEPCRTLLLSDLPATSDRFGSHVPIAKAICELIRTEPGGRAIGLTGTWGSGKSTIIQLIQHFAAETRASAEVEVFVFDAWAHERDPLRRTFLESLVFFLVSRGWTKSTEWQADLDRLRRRREDSETTTTPLLTTPGRLLAVAALFIVPGAAILSRDEVSPFLAWTALLMCLMPLWVAGAAWLWWRPTAKLWTAAFWRGHRGGNDDQGVFSLFLNRTQEVNRSRTIRTPDPTTVEFREIYLRVLTSVGDGPRRRLAIVIDNLDRLHSEEAMGVLATLRTFSDLDASHPAVGRVWVLVPFDPSALVRLLGGGNNSEGEALAVAFRDKTFQVTFRVPPPVLSDWKSFFLDELNSAFPDHHSTKFEQEHETVYWLYRLKGPDPPTPRDVRLFVNRLGALHRQWYDSIPLAMQALYILIGDKIQGSAQVLTTDEFLDQGMIAILNEKDWQRSLAALHFNVEPDKAMQVLIGRQVEQAFSEGQGSALRGLQHLPGYLPACEEVVEQSYLGWAKRQPAMIALAARAVVDSAPSASSSFDRIWRTLERAVRTVEVWPLPTQAVGEGLAELLKRVATSSLEQVATRVLAGLGAALGELEPQAQRVPESGANWVAGVLPVIRMLQASARGDVLEKAFLVRGSSSLFIDVGTAISREHDAKVLGQYFRPAGPGADVVRELAARVTGGTMTPATAETIQLLYETVGKGWPWDEVLSPAFIARLQHNVTLGPQELASCLRVLLSLSTRGLPQAVSAAQGLVTGGHLFHHLHQAKGSGENGGIALCLLAILEYSPSGSVTAQPGNAAPGISLFQELLSRPESMPQVVESLASEVRGLGQVQYLLQVSGQAAQANKLIGSVIEVLSTQTDAEVVLPTGVVLGHVKFIQSVLKPESLGVLVESLVVRGELLNALVTAGFQEELASLYRVALQHASGEAGSEFVNSLLGGLRAVSEPQWTRILATPEDSVLALISALLERGVGIRLGPEFEDSLVTSSRSLVAGGAMPASATEWPRLLKAIEPELRRDFLHRMRDALVSSEEAKGLPLIRLFGEDLLSEGQFDRKAEDFFRYYGKGALERREAEELVWFGKVLEKYPSMPADGSEAAATLRLRIRDALAELETSSEIRPLIVRLGEQLGLSPADLADANQAPD